MHEFGLMRDVVRIVEEKGREAGAERVVSITLRVGALAAADPEHLRAHFVEAARGTLAEGAELRFRQTSDLSDPDAQGIMLQALEVLRGRGALGE